MIRIDEETCTGCDACVPHCPAGIISPGPAIQDDIHSFCVSCGHCAVACPSGSISVEGLEDVKVPPYADVAPVAPEDIATLLRRRRSIRKYTPGPVSEEHVKGIVEAASLVPTAHNWRAFKAYACRDAGVIARLRGELRRHYEGSLRALQAGKGDMPEPFRRELIFAFDQLVVNPPDGKDRLFWGSDTLLVFTTRIPHPLCIGDAWTASFAAMMYAETIAVGTCYNGFLIMGLNEEPSIKRLLRIPSEELVVSGFTLGYPDEKHFRYPPRVPMETTWIGRGPEKGED